ncbi:Cobyrinic acid a,c-diamide synthetase [hydrothermal vent metagenome]|uniref:Cobyrinic acid a,c-diamide synthetase n=1 Tax=hydrothermal vent metagenome TaxID=652676 RepID=A0A3B0YZC2_9ZZZZ
MNEQEHKQSDDQRTPHKDEEDDAATRTDFAKVEPLSSSHCPAVLISAPASGQGKTTVTAALARYFSRQGKTVKVFKTGPDFIDPMILQHASNQSVHQLDLWMVGEDECRQRLVEAGKTADLILIEGVMGLFDGKPSSADLAELFGIPVLVVIDSKGMAQTFGAVAQGLMNYRPGLTFAGVLANRVASNNHAEMLAESLPPDSGQFAYMRKNDNLELPGRHLGLLQANEIDDLDTRLDAATAALHIPDLEQLAVDIHFSAPVKTEFPRLLQGVNIGIARDEAFSFIYAANLECLTEMGARLHFFSPLHEAELPVVDSLWLPGGYPELHAEQLAKNQTMKDSINTHHQAGKPILAECGGMLYLNQTLQTLNEQRHNMVGLLPGQAIMQQRLGGLGMQSVALPEGELRGHTFHYSRLETECEATAQGIKQRNGQAGEAVYQQQRLTASYLHFYFLSNARATAQLFTPKFKTLRV